MDSGEWGGGVGVGPSTENPSSLSLSSGSRRFCLPPALSQGAGRAQAHCASCGSKRGPKGLTRGPGASHRRRACRERDRCRPLAGRRRGVAAQHSRRAA